VTANALLAALARPDAYPHSCVDIRLVETHISWVFLTGDFAYKLKKPLDFGFLDFTTLEKREFYCHEELRCNRRFAPELYLDVVGISIMPDGRIGLAGDGEVIEYAVKMLQFDVEEQLDRVLQRDELDAPLLRRFAEQLADIVDGIPRIPGGANRFGGEHIASPVNENFAELERHCTDPDELAALGRIRLWSEQRHEQLREAFDARADAGYIRECHGDLHLSNLVRRDGEIRAFDCIEFSDDLRCIDPVSDIAFLFMDCSARGREDLAYAFVDSYFNATGDYAGASLLRYYAVYRSLVRAKIAKLKLAQGFDVVTARRFADHLAWADRATSQTRPVVVLMCGVSGSGKSWTAERLAGVLPALRLRSDIARQHSNQLPDPRSVGADREQARYSTSARQAVYAELREHTRSIIAGGDNVIVDATCADAHERRAFEAAAETAGARCVVVWCKAAISCLEARIRQRAQRALDPSEATVGVLHEQLDRFESPGPDEDTITIATDEPFDIERIVERILQSS